MTGDDKQTQNLDDMIASNDTGARNPKGSFGRYSLLLIPLFWSLYQLWIASPPAVLISNWMIQTNPLSDCRDSVKWP